MSISASPIEHNKFLDPLLEVLGWPSIPDPALMAEIGWRVANRRTTYKEIRKPKYEAETPDQPQRTDLEMQVTQTPEQPVPFIEISFPSS